MIKYLWLTMTGIFIFQFPDIIFQYSIPKAGIESAILQDLHESWLNLNGVQI